MEKGQGFLIFLLGLLLSSFLVSATPNLQTKTKFQKDGSQILQQLQEGFYNQICPRAEQIVKRVVLEAIIHDKGLAAGLLRLHSHDCFVRGCDASILLDPTPAGRRVEKQSSFNGKTVRGLDIIDKIKASLESVCPGTVSCADILSFAARDAVVFSGLPSYEVPSGRRDGRISLASDIPANLPSPTNSLENITATFAKKGLSLEEMVVLSGAHSIGRAHCTSFDYRLRRFIPGKAEQDPSLDQDYARSLKEQCPAPGTLAAMNRAKKVVPLNSLETGMLGTSYYAGLLMKRGLLSSDQELMNNPVTKNMVENFASNPLKWIEQFSLAMKKLGTVEVLTGQEGEVRTNCRRVN